MQWKEQTERDAAVEELSRMGSWMWTARGWTNSAPELLVLVTERVLLPLTEVGNAGHGAG